MDSRHRPLSWAEEAELIARAKSSDERPAWMPSAEDIAAYLDEIRISRILMTGSRGWTDRRSIAASLKRALKYLAVEPERAVLVHGGAFGADALAAQVAREMGLALEAHPAQWGIHSDDCPAEDPGDGTCWQGMVRGGRNYCKRAGFRRNKEMIDSRVDILLAFIRDDSRGATGTLDIWLKEDRPAIICRQEAEDPISGEFLNMERWK